MSQTDQPSAKDRTTTNEALVISGGWFLLALAAWALFCGSGFLLSTRHRSRGVEAHLHGAYDKARILREGLGDPALHLTTAGRKKIDALAQGIQDDINGATPNTFIPDPPAGYALLVFGTLAAQAGWKVIARDRKEMGFSFKRKEKD